MLTPMGESLSSTFQTNMPRLSRSLAFESWRFRDVGVPSEATGPAGIEGPRQTEKGWSVCAQGAALQENGDGVEPQGMQCAVTHAAQ